MGDRQTVTRRFAVCLYIDAFSLAVESSPEGPLRKSVKPSVNLHNLSFPVASQQDQHPLVGNRNHDSATVKFSGRQCHRQKGSYDWSSNQVWAL